MSWKDGTWVVLDTETTGLDVMTACVVELGWAGFNRGVPVDSGSTLVDPGCPIPEAAGAIHGITDAAVAGAPSLEVAWEQVAGLVAGADAVAIYNWPYDATILGRMLGRTWDDAVAGKVCLDPLVAVRVVGKYWPGAGRHRLGNVCKRLGIDLFGMHRAQADAMAAGKVLAKVARALPADDTEVVTFLARMRREQDAEREAWHASKVQK